MVTLTGITDKGSTMWNFGKIKGSCNDYAPECVCIDLQMNLSSIPFLIFLSFSLFLFPCFFTYPHLYYVTFYFFPYFFSLCYSLFQIRLFRLSFFVFQFHVRIRMSSALPRINATSLL